MSFSISFIFICLLNVDIYSIYIFCFNDVVTCKCSEHISLIASAIITRRTHKDEHHVHDEEQPLHNSNKSTDDDTYLMSLL